MGHWDELCLLCGISPIPPTAVYDDPGNAEDLADKLVEYDSSLLDDMKMKKETLTDLLEKALEAEYPDGLDWYTRPGWRWNGFMDCVAIGHFRADGDTPHHIVLTDAGYTRKIPDGMDVETRLVTKAMCGEFGAVIHRKLEKDGNMTETEEEMLSRTGARNYLYHELDEISTGNFFLSEGCYHYLQHWLDYSRIPKPSHDRQLSFAGELFEIVNSRKEGRDHMTGTLPYINYDGIEATLQQMQYEVSENMISPQYTAAAIRNGDSPLQILDAITRDCRTWMFHAPDMWPIADVDVVLETTLTKFSLAAKATDMLKPLPNEIFFHIVQYTDSLQTYFTLARTSKWLCNELNDSLFLNRAFRAMASSPSGCLFWTQPVASMNGEVKKAYEAASTFLSNVEFEGDSPAAKQKSGSPFARRDFPWLSFIRLCWRSDFMRNRKRLWMQVKQMEEVWIDYRVHGWEIDRFGVPLE